MPQNQLQSATEQIQLPYDSVTVRRTAKSALEQASLEVLYNHVSIRKAAQSYGVTHPTLYRYLKKNTPYVARSKNDKTNSNETSQIEEDEISS